VIGLTDTIRNNLEKQAKDLLDQLKLVRDVQLYDDHDKALIEALEEWLMKVRA
jgi:hypothetical protein